MEHTIRKNGCPMLPVSRFKILLVCFLTIVSLVLFSFSSQAQDNSDILSNINADKYFKTVNEKSRSFNNSVDKYTQKVLSRMLKQEQKMRSIVTKKDSMLSKRLFDYAIDSIQRLKSMIKNKETRVENFLHRSRIPYVDSLKKSLLFFEKNTTALKSLNSMSASISGAREQVSGVESKTEALNKIQAFLQDRKNILSAELKAFPQLTKHIQQFCKEAFYYKAQIAAYKETLSSPDKIEKIVLGKLQNIPAFQKLGHQLPGPFSSLVFNGNSTQSSEAILVDSGQNITEGLPARASVQKFIQTFSPGISASFDPLQQIRQQVDKADEQMPTMPEKLLDMFRSAKNKLSTSSQQNENDFASNSQRVKSFWKRIDYGADLQFGKSVNYLPATSNITLKLGYQLDDKKTVGIGIAYIMGMGYGWKNIAITHQGIGLKSYIKWNWKKGFALQGEAGWNYMAQFKNIEALKNNIPWQKAGLIGISKDLKLTKKVKANIQFMFDLFYKTHIPYTQPTVFRFGYGF